MTSAASSRADSIQKITTLVDKVGLRVDWLQKEDLIAFGKRGSDGYSDLYTMNPDGSNQVCFTCGKPGVPQLNNDQPAWHPSGEYLLFQSQDPELKFPPGLSKPAERVLADAGQGFNNNLWIAARDGKKFYQLTRIRSFGAVLHAHFSHDGTKLLWTERVPEGTTGGHWVLKLADFVADDRGAQLSNEKIYTALPGEDAFYESHGFSLDDTQIIFSACPDSRLLDLDIYQLDLKTEKLAKLTDSAGIWDEHAILSPSGKKIIWGSSTGYPNALSVKWMRTLKLDYWLMNADGSGKTQITFFNAPGDPAYSPDVRITTADSSWNKKGDKLVCLLGVWKKNRPPESRIILIEFTDPQ